MIDYFSFVSYPITRYLLIPIITVFVGAWARFSSRNDKCNMPKQDLFYWSHDLIVSGFIVVFADFAHDFSTSGDLVFYQKVLKFVACLGVCFLGLIIVNMVIRKRGWVIDTSVTTSQPRLHLWKGIILPNLFAALVLLAIYFIMQL